MSDTSSFGLPRDAIAAVRQILLDRKKPVDAATAKPIEEKVDKYVPNFDHMIGHLHAHTNELHQMHFAPTGSAFHNEFKRHHPEVHARLKGAFDVYRQAVEAAVKASHKTKPLREESEAIIKEFNDRGKAKDLLSKVYHDGFGFGDVMVESGTTTEIMFEHGIEKVPTDTLQTLDQLVESPRVGIELIQVDTTDQAMQLGNKYHEKAKGANSMATRRAMNAVAARYYRKARLLKQSAAGGAVDESVQPELATEQSVLTHIAQIAEATKTDQKMGASLALSLYGETGVNSYYNELKTKGVEIVDEARRGRPPKMLDPNASNDDEDKGADNHIVVRLRKAVSLRGAAVHFNDGSSHHVEPEHARKALDLYGRQKKPDDRESTHKKLSASHDSFKQAIGV